MPPKRVRSASKSKSPQKEVSQVDKKEQQRRAREYIEQQLGGSVKASSSKKSSPGSSGKRKASPRSAKKPVDSSEDESSDDNEEQMIQQEREEINSRSQAYAKAQLKSGSATKTPPAAKGGRRSNRNTPELVESEDEEPKSTRGRSRTTTPNRTPPVTTSTRKRSSTSKSPANAPYVSSTGAGSSSKSPKRGSGKRYVADNGPFGDGDQSDDTTPLSDDEGEIPTKRGSPFADTGGIQVGELGRGSGYNPDEDPWWVEHVDIVSVFVIVGTFCAALYYSGAFNPSTSMTLASDSNIFDVMNWQVILAVGFFPIFYIASITGWLGFVFTVIGTVISKIFTGASSEESKAEVVDNPRYSTSTATSRGRAPSTVSSRTNTSPYGRLQSTSPVRARNTSVGPSRRAASDTTPPPAASTEVTSEDTADAIANKFFSFFKFFMDHPHILNIIFVILCIASTYYFYTTNNAKYALLSSGVAALAIAVQAYILLNSRKSKRQELVYKLVLIIKDKVKVKTQRETLGYAVADVKEDILDYIEDKTWEASTPGAVRELTMEKFEALWKEVETGVTSERRILLHNVAVNGKVQTKFWKYKFGSQDPKPTQQNPFSFNKQPTYGGRM